MKSFFFGLLISFTTLYANPLIVGTNAEFPPFAYIEENAIVGFDIDIAKEVGARLGKEIKIVDLPFDALIPQLALKRFDFVAAGMTYTKERSKRALFSKPYINQDPFVICTNNKELNTPESLIGKKVVVIEGFTADLFLSSQKGIELVRLPTQADGFMAIKCGRADAFVTAKSTVDAFEAVHDSNQFYSTILDGTGDSYALVFPKSKATLLAEVEAVLDAMEEDGTIDLLKTKWGLK